MYYEFSSGLLLFIILISCLLFVLFYVSCIFFCKSLNRREEIEIESIDISSIYVNIHELPRANNIELVNINNNNNNTNNTNNNNEIIIVNVLNSELQLPENNHVLPIANVV